MQVPRWKNLLSMRNHFALFHSTPVSNAKWKSKWNSDAVRGQQPPKNHIKYVTRQKRADTKKALKDILYYSSSYKRSNNTFRDEDITWVPDGTNIGNPEKKNKQTRSKRSSGRARTHHSSRGNKCKQRKDGFCSDDDEDPETIFQATFGGRCFTWSFKSWEDSHFQKPSYGFEWRDGKANWTRNNRRREWETDEDGDTEGESNKSSLLGSMSDRTVLGLPPTGPLKMEDVKSAFRASAMKWHPDKHQGPSQSAGEVAKGSFYINGDSSIGRVDDDFVCATLDWWPSEKCDYGTCSWGRASLLNLDLNNAILLNAIKAFSPLKIRLGGTLQDIVIYDVGDTQQTCTSFMRNSSQMFGFTQGCLPMSRWDELNLFFQKVNARVIFGLNALNGRVKLADGSLGGPWNFTNAVSLIRYTVNKGYTIHGWELGNELSGSGVGARIGPSQYASDVVSLQSIIQDIYKGFEVKPSVLAPGGFFDDKWFNQFIHGTLPNSLDVITHHIYNLGPGVDEHLEERILNPSYLDGVANTFRNLQNILKSSKTSATAWVGEAGGAYNSGRNHVTNAFIFSFWYLDQLGMASLYDTKTYCRQSLIGGNYGLLDTTTFVPNPDYYSALLWHRLMGRNVLSTKFSGTKYMRAYAHCAKESQGITLLLINLDGNTAVQVQLTINSTLSVGRILKQGGNWSSLRSKFSRMSRALESTEITTRDEYPTLLQRMETFIAELCF